MHQGAIPENDPRLLARAVLGMYNSVWTWYRPHGIVELGRAGDSTSSACSPWSALRVRVDKGRGMSSSRDISKRWRSRADSSLALVSTTSSSHLWAAGPGRSGTQSPAAAQSCADDRRGGDRKGWAHHILFSSVADGVEFALGRDALRTPASGSARSYAVAQFAAKGRMRRYSSRAPPRSPSRRQLADDRPSGSRRSPRGCSRAARTARGCSARAARTAGSPHVSAPAFVPSLHVGGDADRELAHARDAVDLDDPVLPAQVPAVRGRRPRSSCPTASATSSCRTRCASRPGSPSPTRAAADRDGDGADR